MPIFIHSRDLISAEPSVSTTSAGTIKTIGGVPGGGTISAGLDRLPATRRVWASFSKFMTWRTLQETIGRVPAKDLPF
jgi:hypothetical protein